MFNKNPAIILGAIAEVIKAVIPALIIFSIIHWTPEQIAAVMLVVNVSIGAIVTILTRAQVTPNNQVDSLIKTAVEQPSGTPVEVVKSIQATKDS